MDNINPDFDVVFGDTFLRNVYSVYDFGDFDADGSTTAPYMQFLSQISRSTVISETLDIRTAAIAANGPELPPKDLLALLNSDSSSPSTGNDLASKGNKSKTTVGGDVDFSDGSDDDASSQIARWGPVVVGLLGANLVVGLVLLGLGVINCLRRGGKADPTTKNASQVAVYTPLQNKDKDEHVGGYGGGNGYHYDTPYSQASS
ncbi:hypothetical protein H0H87_008985 [Tephrocybe sp. NHM501043]|nr:hypothetical protein H0H87_008985 [Tephrocybe sp. NHM501043]